MPRLLVEQVDRIDGSHRLLVASDEQAVGEFVRSHSVKRAHAIPPMIAQPNAVSTDDVEADETRISDPRLEPGREYDAVGPVFPFADGNAMLRQTLHAAPLCVDQS